MQPTETSAYCAAVNARVMELNGPAEIFKRPGVYLISRLPDWLVRDQVISGSENATDHFHDPGSGPEGNCPATRTTPARPPPRDRSVNAGNHIW